MSGEDKSRDLVKELQALEKEQFLFNALMDNLTDHVYFKDLESRFIRNNKAHAISFGFDDPGELAGKSDFDFFTEQAARQAYDDEQSIIKTGHPIIKEEKLTRKDKTVAWFSAIKIPLRDSEGKIIGTFGMSRDITERKNTEDALKHSEERFRSLAQSANDAIITTNSNGEIIGWNLGAESIFHFKEPEITGLLLGLIIPEDSLKILFKEMDKVKSEKENAVLGKIIELTGVKKNGIPFPIELSFSQWTTSEGTFLTCIVRDITKRKRTELENQILYKITQ